MTDPRSNNLGYWSHDAALAGPRRLAMIDLSGAAPREVSYAEFEERLDRFAALLRAAGIAPGVSLN